MKPLLFLLLLLFLFTCDTGPSPALTPDQEMATFQVAQGYRIELVASDPMIQDPIVIRFDEEGRLWVVEMRGFMPDIDGTGEDAPVGRVSILTDQDQDGLMDNSTVFIDSLVLPRGLAIVKGGALIAEDATLWYAQDTDNDLKADKRTMVDPDYGNKGVVEHSANGLWRGMDNWIYNAKSKFRYRQVDGEWKKEETEFRGQWGICHDNSGKLYYNYNWSQLHMDLVPPNYLSRNPHHQPTSGIDHALSQDRRVFPIRSNLAINRGYVEGTLDAEGKIIEFASACAPFIYRGDLLGTETVGNAFVCEPTGNLVKRNLVEYDQFYPMARNAYQDREFLASTDERFRPVWLESGPDGALYIVDMYRGIVQHGPYMSPYLREVTLERKLDQPINLGRIWRVVPDNKTVSENPIKISSLTSSELVDLLVHDNGWYRDMAQRILVDRSDSDIIDSLKELVLGETSHVARLHALWTLEGLEYQDLEFFLQVLENPDTTVKAAALRIMEKEAIKTQEGLTLLENALQDTSLHLPDLQTALTAGAASSTVKQKLLLDILTRHPESQVYRDAVISSLYQEEYHFLDGVLDHPDWQEPTAEKEIIIEQLAASITAKSDPYELSRLLEFLDQASLDWKQLAILTGISFHRQHSDSAINLEHAPGIFSRNFQNKDVQDKILRSATLFSWPGKAEEPPESQKALALEFDPEVIARGRNLYLTICASCHGNDGAGMARFAPPLSNSEWVLGDPEQLSKILLHGIEGPLKVNGKIYDVPEILPVMPAFATTPPEDLAAIMTYIRQAWGNSEGPVNPGMVGRVRVLNQGKVTPWTAEELSVEFPTSNQE